MATQSEWAGKTSRGSGRGWETHTEKRTSRRVGGLHTEPYSPLGRSGTNATPRSDLPAVAPQWAWLTGHGVLPCQHCVLTEAAHKVGPVPCNGYTEAGEEPNPDLKGVSVRVSQQADHNRIGGRRTSSVETQSYAHAHTHAHPTRHLRATCMWQRTPGWCQGPEAGPSGRCTQR